uniref:Dendritic cell-specific transmembrane protein-like domain-containing protein n=1 Tax=Panagrellus redivivus TaxID=6233 RepID=A0A7E4VZE4_PANRE
MHTFDFDFDVSQEARENNGLRTRQTGLHPFASSTCFAPWNTVSTDRFVEACYTACSQGGSQNTYGRGEDNNHRSERCPVSAQRDGWGEGQDPPPTGTAAHACWTAATSTFFSETAFFVWRCLFSRRGGACSASGSSDTDQPEAKGHRRSKSREPGLGQGRKLTWRFVTERKEAISYPGYRLTFIGEGGDSLADGRSVVSVFAGSTLVTIDLSSQSPIPPTPTCNQIQSQPSNMLMNTGEKLIAIQNKIHTIQDRLEANRLRHEDDDDTGCCGVAPHAWRSFFANQTFYAHIMKIVALFIIAVVHLVYMQPFLDAFVAIDSYAEKVVAKYPATLQTPHGLDTRAISRQVALLQDYKHNIWMTVGAMCVSLSTTCFFLFLLPVTPVRRLHVNLIKIVDIVSFAFLPAMLGSRIVVAEMVRNGLRGALQTAHQLTSANRLMNTLVCSIHDREGLPNCADLVLRSILPIVVLKYLFILAILTLAYIALAYLIEYCIRHWFPPTHSKHTSSSRHHCYHGHGSNVYMPVILPPKNPLIDA